MTPAPQPPFDWYPLLEPGEKVFWQGQPRQGAGWRCVLREAPLELATSAAFLFAFIGYGVHAEGGSLIWAVGLAAVGIPVIGAWSLARRGKALAAMRYALTDRRSMSVDLRDLTVLVTDHSHARPVRRETLCGSVIDVGRARRFKTRERGVMAWRDHTDSDNKPSLRFTALDPGEAPFERLSALAHEANPLGQSVPTIAESWLRDRRPESRLPEVIPARREAPSASVPGMTDYVPPTAPAEGQDPA